MTGFPDWLEPMAATLTQDRFTGPEWIFERKFDGIRLLAFKNGSDVRLLSRNRLPLNSSHPSVVEAIANLPVHDVVLDGEAAWGWGALGQADYYVFDILWLDGRDVTGLPLDERRALLSSVPLRLPLAQVAVAGRSEALGARAAPKDGRASSRSAATRSTNIAARSTG